MPIIYEAKLDGTKAVRYFHFSLVRFYLEQGYEYGKKAKDEHQEGVLLPSSVIGIMFSAMALEAFANEISEDIIPKPELNDFIRLRKVYKKSRGESSIRAKLRILFGLKHNHILDQKQMDEIEELISLRHNLVHYKLTELSGKYIMPPVRTTVFDDGQSMSTIDFMVQPERIDPPFIHRVSGEAAAKCFNTALSVINSWGVLSGVSNNIPGLEKIV